MFICLFVCLFFYIVLIVILIILGHPQEYTLKFFWRSDLIWLTYKGSKNVCLFFVCLLIDLFVFYFSHSETPTESSPENFVKIQLDLAEILRIRKLDFKMFICFLFVCLFMDLLVFCFSCRGTLRDVSQKVLWRYDLIWQRYQGSKNICLFVCLFVYRFVCFLL